MGKRQEIKILPSRIILPDDSAADPNDSIPVLNDSAPNLESVPEEKRQAIQRQLCQNAGRSLSLYYSSHPEEWEDFLNVMGNDL